jgi:uncharacterized membrane protein
MSSLVIIKYYQYQESQMSNDRQPPEIHIQEVIFTPDANDVAENKIVASLAYIGPLFLVPLLAAKHSPFAKFHTSQGFILFLGWIIISIVGWIPLLGWLVGFFGTILLVILSVVGVVNALKGQMKKLPVTGNIRIL